ncbi:hypothetical protein P8452_35662 [Trifolium repens]|nr:hypothetical protein P8452_35662 [Trifolium repens]
MSPSNNVISLVQSSPSMSSSLGTSKELQKLRILCVECGSDLQLTQNIARFLYVLKATNCQDLEESASSTTSEIFDMHASPLIDDCLGQVQTSNSKNHLKSLLIQMGTKWQVSNIAEDCVLQTADETWDSFLLPCDNNSEWLTFSCKGCSIVFDIPTVKGRNLKSMILFVVYYSSSENIISEGCQVDKEMERCHVVDEEDVVVSYNVDNSVSFSDGDDIGVPANNNGTCFDQDGIISEDKQHWRRVDESSITSGDDAVESDKNYAIPGGSDMATDKKVTVCGEDENVSDIKNKDAVDKDVKVSVEADKNAVSIGDKNRFRGLFTKLPPLVRAVLMSRPFWSSLIGILVLIAFHHFKKRRSPDLLTRYTRRGKWLWKVKLVPGIVIFIFSFIVYLRYDMK